MSPDEKRRVHALAAEGLSARAIARALGSTHPTVAKILAEQAPAAPPKPELPEHMRPPAAPDPAAFAAETPAIETVRELMQDARKQIAAANASGDSQLAQRHTRNAAALASVLARLERIEAESSDVVWHCTREQAERIKDQLTDRIKAICNRPILCTSCSRALSVFWGTGGGNAPPNT